MQNAKGLWDLNHEELKLHSCDKILINQLKHKPSIILLFFCRNLEHNNSLECAVTIIVSFLIFFFISFVFGFFFFKLGKRQHQMGAHYIMVEYYPGTKSSHLLVMMHIRTKASEHPWLHTSHCGSSMTRCVPWQLGAVSPFSTMGKEDSSTGRREEILLLLRSFFWLCVVFALCVCWIFLVCGFFFSLQPLPMPFNYFLILLSISGYKIGMISVSKPSKNHRSFCKVAWVLCWGNLG